MHILLYVDRSTAADLYANSMNRNNIAQIFRRQDKISNRTWKSRVARFDGCQCLERQPPAGTSMLRAIWDDDRPDWTT